LESTYINSEIEARMIHRTRGKSASFCTLPPVLIPIRWAELWTSLYSSWWHQNRGQGSKSETFPRWRRARAELLFILWSSWKIFSFYWKGIPGQPQWVAL